MPQYTVGLEGGGFMTVNASDPDAARENAGQGAGATVISGGQAAHQEGGQAVGGYAPGYDAGGQTAGRPASGGAGQTPAGQGPGADAYAAALQQVADAYASGNREAFARAVHEWDLTFGLDKDKFAEDTRRFNQTFGITEGGLTGMYQGQATLPALTSYATQFGQWGVPQTGAQTLAAQQQAYAQQMGMISQAATLQANPFRQQQAIGQMGNLLGGQGVAGFSAPTTVQGVGTAGGNTRGGMGYLEQMVQDIRDPTANQASMNQILNATPTPNKLNSVEFMRAAPSTQSLTLQAMQERYGLDPADSLKQIQATMPQFTAPALGQIKR